MGQYFNPSILKKNWKTAKNPVAASLKCYDYDNGAKLMEHSYIGNDLVRSIEYLLANRFKGHAFVWCGDYADEVETKTGTHDIYCDAGHFIYEDYDSSTNDRKAKRYLALMKSIPAMPEWKEGVEWNAYETIPYYKYLINYSKKQYCTIPVNDNDKYQVHPLPLFTCAGNSLGGGDYRLQNDKYDYTKDERIGAWAFDKIGITNDKKEIIGMTKIDSYFPCDI